MPKSFTEAGIRALVFDFDATLARQAIDFDHMRREALAAAAAHVTLPDRPDLRTMELLALVGTATENTRNAQKAARDAIRKVEVAAAATSSLFPFVRPMLQRARELGLPMAIVTRNCREAVQTVFPDVTEHFTLLTRDDVPRVKPDPVHLTMALDRVRVMPEQALMIGDHPMDIEVGKNAGAMTAGVATGDHSLDDLRECGPDYLAADGGELMRMLRIL